MERLQPCSSRQARGEGQVGGVHASDCLGVGQKEEKQWERERRRRELMSCGEVKDRLPEMKDWHLQRGRQGRKKK